MGILEHGLGAVYANSESINSLSRVRVLFEGNIARGKPTRQSSTGFGGVPQRAVDGNKNSNWNGKSCTHTNKQAKPWWRVDLQSIQQVAKVGLTNRADCCANRLRQIDIKVGNVDGNPDANALYVCTSFCLIKP